MTDSDGIRIRAVAPDGVGAELGLMPEDRILSMNGIRLADYIDYLMESAAETISLEVQRPSGEIELIEFDKDPEESLGLDFDAFVFDGIRECNNHCIFCFVHQMPAGQRETLYLRDDDYRLSFLQGGYITLTNLTDADWDRILRFHLSPLYVSVHATDPAMRRRLLGSKHAGPIMDQLRRLTDAGIAVHTQAVICPGENDGAVLERTITDLASLWPGVASLAVVPVGLTGHRHGLYSLRNVTGDEARATLDLIDAHQRKYLKEFDTRFVFAADEWYIAGDRPFPENGAYEDYPQLDNGGGLIRKFIAEFQEVFPDIAPKLKRKGEHWVIVTGEATRRLWETVLPALKAHVPHIQIKTLSVSNRFLGASVTVTGLLSGNDLIRAIEGDDTDAAVYLIPEIVLKQGETLFLDNVSLPELRERCGSKRIEIVPTQAGAWLEWMSRQGGT